MKFITVEEAKQFVPLKNDMKSDLGDAAYYTFTPSKRGADWEDITYYLPRRKRMYEGRKGDGDSWAFRCFNAERLEGEVHKQLQGYRISKDREFFAISLNEAKETVEDLGQKYV